jgi:hypothetical protein
MGWRDLKPLDDWYELERPEVTHAGGDGFPAGGHIALDFHDSQSREWMAEWLRSKRGWVVSTAWVDEKR